MALNKEIWVNDIQRLLVPDNSFLTKGTDYSAFADNHNIHIPVEYGSVNTEIDRAVLPGTVTVSNDTEKVITMHHFTTDPIRLFNPEDVELSYDKRSIVVDKIAEGLNRRIAEYALTQLRAIGAKTGTNITTILRGVAQEFDEGDYPEQDRYVLLSADSYAKLLKELTDTQSNAFLSLANASTGVIGQIFGLNVFKRSSLGGNAAAIAWHKRDYMYALSKPEVYTDESNPQFYGTILSASARFGCFVPTQEGDGGTTGD